MSDLALVTGANGFVGSHLVDRLLEKGMRVRVLVRKSSDMKWLKGKNIEINNGGLFDKEELKNALEGVSYVFHVAGTVKSKKPEGYFRTNVDATRNLLDAALEFKDQIKKVVVVGSQTSAGPSPAGKIVNENDTPSPITTYGRSKLEQEKLSLTYADKLPVTVCRSPAVYGERDTEVFIFFKTYASGLFTTIGFDKKRLSLIHVSDLVEGLYLAGVTPASSGQVYFISSEEIYTWEQIGDITGKALGKKAIHLAIPHFIVYTVAAIAQFFSMFSSKAATLNLEKARDIVQSAWTCDTSKAVKQLGYRQQVSLEAGIKRTIEWSRKEGWLK